MNEIFRRGPVFEKSNDQATTVPAKDESEAVEEVQNSSASGVRFVATAVDLIGGAIEKFKTQQEALKSAGKRK